MLTKTEQPSWIDTQKSISSTFQEMIDVLQAEWKKTAFFEMYEGAGTGEIAKKYGLGISYISRWRHSEEYTELLLSYSRVKFLKVLPKAVIFMTNLIDQVEVTVEDKRKHEVAKDIVGKVGLFSAGSSGAIGQGQGNTLVNIINMNGKELEKEIREKMENIKVLAKEVKSE